jgi:hypothetical protein
LVQKYRDLDIHRKADKGSKAELKELTLQENLNYIKYNSRNAEQALRIFKTSESIAQYPEFSSAIIQRMCQSIAILTNPETRYMMSVQPEYKAMLKIINKKAAMLDDKNLVDNIYALGKIHKHHTDPLNLSIILKDYLEEVADR